MSKIVVTLPLGGAPVIKTEGVAGPACSLKTLKLQRALGSVSADVPTAEMYEIPTKTTLGTAERSTEG